MEKHCMHIALEGVLSFSSWTFLRLLCSCFHNSHTVDKLTFNSKFYLLYKHCLLDVFSLLAVSYICNLWQKNPSLILLFSVRLSPALCVCVC